MDNNVKKYLKNQKISLIITIICFVAFGIIQIPLFAIETFFSMDGGSGFIEIIEYMGIYLSISLIYLLPQLFTIVIHDEFFKSNKDAKKIKDVNDISYATIKTSKLLSVIWVLIFGITIFVMLMP